MSISTASHPVGPASSPEEVRSAFTAPDDRARSPRWEAALRIALTLLDLLALAVGIAAGMAFADPYPVSVAAAGVTVWLLALHVAGAYDLRHLGSGTAEIQRVVNISVRVWLGLMLVAYVTSTDSARGLVLVTVPVGCAALVATRLAARRVLLRLRRQRRCRHRVVAVGTVRDVLHLVEAARRSPGAGFEIVGACIPLHMGADRRRTERRGDLPAGSLRSLEGSDRRGSAPELLNLGIPIVGGAQDVLPAVGDLHADSVVVAGPGVLSRSAMRRLAWQLERSPVRLFVAAGLSEIAAPRLALQPLGGLPLLQVEAPAFTGVRRRMKDALDRMTALLLLVPALPLLGVLAMLIRLDSPGPVLFRQERIGMGGRPFACYKLRTMHQDADARVAELLERNDGDGVLFKMRTDPRVTQVGRVLRRLSLDELPQLYNVLNGTMSLVGPRPPLAREVEQYGDEVRRRLLVKPGMTGLWQVSGRSDLSWGESVRLDLYYVENWSPLLDLSIMVKTVTAVVAGRGAY